MKAVAAALLLIIGAAVVLWYGNTLNSWVLGGLIGGLAALLLSIPTSLVLFSYLSRRHDERLRAQAEQEAALALAYDLQEARADLNRAYEVEGSMLPAQEAYPRQIEAPARNLPAPSSQRGPGALAPRPSAKKVPARRSTGRIYYPGFPGYEPGSFHSQQRAAALRAARMEAARREQYDDEDVEVLPTRISKQLPPARPHESQSKQGTQPITQLPTRELSQRRDNQQYRYRPHLTVDASPAQSATRHSPAAAGENRAAAPRDAERHTDYRHSQSSETGPFNQRTFSPQTDQIARHQRWNEQSSDPETITGSLQKPLVRRAPYVDDNDPLLVEMTRQIDAPVVRRASRMLEHDEEDK